MSDQRPRPLRRRRGAGISGDSESSESGAGGEHQAAIGQARGLWSLFGGGRDDEEYEEGGHADDGDVDDGHADSVVPPRPVAPTVAANPWRQVAHHYEDDVEDTSMYEEPALPGPLFGGLQAPSAPLFAGGSLYAGTQAAFDPGLAQPGGFAPAPIQPAAGATRPHKLPEPSSYATIADYTPPAAELPANLPVAVEEGDDDVDPGKQLKQRAQDSLIEALGGRLYDQGLSEQDLNDLVIQHLNEFFADEDVPLSVEERRRLAREVTDDLLRHGPIEPLLADPGINEVMVNGTKGIYIEKGGRLVLTKVRFASDHQLRRVIERIVGRVGRRIDESSPMVDARLPDGSRVNAIIPPLSVDGPILTIRKFTADSYTVDDLVKWKTLTPQSAFLLEACVRGRMNILVSGGTGSGKTTLLNILSSFIPSDERIVTIEDAVELRLRQHHVIRLEARPPNIEGKGAIHIRDLLRNSLRMRPDRIVVGEVRGGECLDMLQAMNTGHDGSLSTLHANSPRDAVSRIETMVLMAGIELPIRAIREQVASAVDLIVHTARLKDGTRRVTSITEVVGMEGDIVTLSEIFTLAELGPLDENGKHMGCIGPTGLRPGFAAKLADHGITLPGDLFGEAGFPTADLQAQRRRR